MYSHNGYKLSTLSAGHEIKNIVLVFWYFPLWRSRIVVGPVGAWWTGFLLVPSVHRLS